MTTVQVRAYTLSEKAFDTFKALYETPKIKVGKLPSKVGFNELVDLELAKKDPMNEDLRMLTRLGAHEAAVYFSKVAPDTKA